MVDQPKWEIYYTTDPTLFPWRAELSGTSACLRTRTLWGLRLSIRSYRRRMQKAARMTEQLDRKEGGA